MKKIILSFLISMCLTGCVETSQNYAPVVDAEQIEAIPKIGYYRTQPGETLYSIAWRYGLDYKSVAQRNHLAPPYHLRAGQIIYLRGKTPRYHPQSLQKPKLVSEQEPVAIVKRWSWPAKGRIVGTFSDLNRGLNIASYRGAPIFASAAGKVVYAGEGLRGYGKLIIIKHNDNYLTAYAHNKKMLVKTGQWVKSSQQIAEMGNSGSKYIMLHFEMRRNGSPMNPMLFL